MTGRTFSRIALAASLLATLGVIAAFRAEGSDLELFLGRFHPLLVHLPIGFLVLAGLLELLGRRLTVLKPSVGPVLLLTAIVAVLAVITGLLLGSGGAYESSAFNWHKRMGLTLSLTVLLTTVFWFAHQAKPSPRLGRIYTGFLCFSMVLLVAAGHFGSTLTHGSGYLTDYVPDSLRRLFLLGGPEGERTPLRADQVILYHQLVDPILSSRCVSCHGPDKSNGGLRLDAPEYLQKGGESGALFVPGDASGGELIRRIWLPPAHRDAMPPRGRTPLAVAEATILRWWIEQGGSFEQTLAEAELPPEVQTIVETTLGPIRRGEPAIFALQVSAPDLSAVQRLKGLGIGVAPLADGTHFLQVHCTNVRESFEDEQLRELLPLAQQITWLDLSGTQITDAGLAVVAQLPHLSRLQLERTRIGDAGLAHMAKLEHLEYLNLYGTRVTDGGLEHLEGLANLRNLYVWQTEVSKEGAEGLKRRLPRLSVDLGLPAGSFGPEAEAAPDATGRTGRPRSTGVAGAN